MLQNQNIIPVILCGGMGSRLWPLSRTSLPKQFATLISGDDLFGLTLERVKKGSFDKPLIVASESHRFHVSKKVADIGMQCDVLLEPSGRNTAPAIMMAALHLKSQGRNGQMLILPSDHLIPDVDQFVNAVHVGLPSALNDMLVTFGVSPTSPKTGYGYIQAVDAGSGLRDVLAFHEKPDRERAEQMLATGQYLWNSGIFLIGVDRLLSLAERHQSDMLMAVKTACADFVVDGEFYRPNLASWNVVPSDSIDYALVEKCEGVVCVPYTGQWSDMGDWNSVFAVNAEDKNGNRLNGAVTAIDCFNSNLWSTNDQTQLVGLGLNGIMAVATDDAIMVADVQRTQDVRSVVSILDKAGLPQAHQHTKDYRPWGWFESLILSPGYQVKRLHVAPKARLSLQSHKHRSEHWVVVAGTATVVINERKFKLNVNESVYINIGDKHRLANDTEMPLTIIEVQTGSYLGEDDIVRYQDDFSR